MPGTSPGLDNTGACSRRRSRIIGSILTSKHRTEVVYSFSCNSAGGRNLSAPSEQMQVWFAYFSM